MVFSEYKLICGPQQAPATARDVGTMAMPLITLPVGGAGSNVATL